MPTPQRPSIVYLCGNMRFPEAFELAAHQETLEGKIVLRPEYTPDQPFQIPVQAQKKRLDELQLRKIDLADEVLILNVDGEIDESTNRAVAYARNQQKRVRFLEEERNMS